MTLNLISIEEAEEHEAKRCPHGWSIIADHRVAAPRMLVKGLLPYEGIAFIGGQSGSGKTFIAVDLSVALASQTTFFGRAVKERVGVAFIAAEGGGQIGNRLRASAMLGVSKLIICRSHGAVMHRCSAMLVTSMPSPSSCIK